MGGRFERGISTFRDSVDLFLDNPRLAVLPLLSLASVGGTFGLVGLVALRHGLLANLLTDDLLLYSGIFLAVAVSSSVGTFFNAAVAHCASRYFDGEPVSVREGLRAAWAERKTILLWALTAATIGTVLSIIDDKLGPVGSLATLVFDIAWSLLTFFVVPVIVLEDADGVRAVLRESGETFRRTWGESVTVSLSVGVVFLPVILSGGGSLVWAYLFGEGLLAAVVGATGFLSLVGALVCSQAVATVAKTALYRYAADGDRVGPFANRRPDRVISPK